MPCHWLRASCVLNFSRMYNHFLECSLDELVLAYEHFTYIKDYEGCHLIGEAFDQMATLDLKGFMI